MPDFDTWQTGNFPHVYLTEAPKISSLLATEVDLWAFHTTGNFKFVSVVKIHDLGVTNFEACPTATCNKRLRKVNMNEGEYYCNSCEKYVDNVQTKLRATALLISGKEGADISQKLTANCFGLVAKELEEIMKVDPATHLRVQLTVQNHVVFGASAIIDAFEKCA